MPIISVRDNEKKIDERETQTNKQTKKQIQKRTRGTKTIKKG